MNAIQTKSKKGWINTIVFSTIFFSFWGCSKVYPQIQNQHMLWCCIAEQHNASSNDALVKTLEALIQAQTCAILTSNHLFSFIGFSDDELQEIKNKWRIFDYNNTFTLMIPHTQKYANSFKEALESEEFFTSTSLEEQLNDDTEFIPYSGTFVNGLEKLLIQEEAPLFLVLTGHGTYLESSGMDANSFTQQKRICGMQLHDVLNIGRILEKKNTKALFMQTCYGSSSDVGSILGKENFSFPIISGGFSDAHASTTGMCTDNILQFNDHVQKISQFTKENQENLFKAMDVILRCDKAPNNIPYVLWPRKPQFSILSPLPRPADTSNNTDNQIKVHRSLVLTQPDIEKISLNDSEMVVAGGAMYQQPRLQYTIDELNITTSENDSANTSHPQLALLKRFNNLGSKRKNVFKIKKTHFHHNGHISTYKNIRVLCKQGVTGVMYSDNQNQCFIASQELQTNNIIIRPCAPPPNDSF
ncbi:hypothetical protein KJZ61_00390 [Candidatus Dependentiae bacterium]|nr:hypothetical protein [Candidatus Dependentiae bacterium]